MNETKILSARVPFENYIDVIRRAQQCKLSVSDYLIFLLFEDTEKQASVQHLTAQNKLLEKQLTAAIQDIQVKLVEIERLNKELEKATSIVKELPIPKPKQEKKVIVAEKEKNTVSIKKKTPTKPKQQSIKEKTTTI